MTYCNITSKLNQSIVAENMDLAPNLIRKIRAKNIRNVFELEICKKYTKQ